MTLEDALAREARTASFKVEVISEILGKGYRDSFASDSYKNYTFRNDEFEIINEASY
ncbi:MAG TPA: hypothetical protein VJH68_03955 [Candidatus Nanoarchaeia archaeon]|nr:hypothetical protein [Candidatus Nanoarchaeia archaeon]